jgi:hypothetical protein
MVQELRRKLPEFERRNKIPNLFPRSLAERGLTVTLYGHVELVPDDGSTSVQLHATTYSGNKAQPEQGHFNTVRIKPGGRSSNLQFAQMMLIFEATLSDGAQHQLVLVRNFTQTHKRRKISGVECSDTLLKLGDFSVIRLTDLVDAYHVVPDVKSRSHGDVERFVANPHIFTCGS